MLRAIKKYLPQYEYVYLGDTKNLPYGDKSREEIYKNTKKAIEYLFEQDCVLVILACNTASAQALRKIQQEWLPESRYKNRKVLGVIRPTVESVGSAKKIGLIGTAHTVNSGAYLQELQKINPKIKLFSLAAPKLVPMIESGRASSNILPNDLAKFRHCDALILGCTHYPVLKKEFKKILGKGVKIVSQDEIIPKKLKIYLKNHPEIRKKLSKNKKVKILVTRKTKTTDTLAKKWFISGAPKLVSL